MADSMYKAVRPVLGELAFCGNIPGRKATSFPIWRRRSGPTDGWPTILSPYAAIGRIPTMGLVAYKIRARILPGDLLRLLAH